MPKPSQQLSPKAALYDRDYFERMHRFAFGVKYQTEADELLQALRVEPGDLVLDVGCNVGRLTEELRADVGVRAVGVDFPAAALEHWRGKQALYVRADAHDLPFGDDTFHAVYLMHVIGHVYAPARVLSECRRVLRPSGRLIVVTPNAGFVWAYRPLNMAGIVPYRRDPTVLRYYSPWGLSRAVQAAGFRQVAVRSFGQPPRLLAALGRGRLAPLVRERLVAVATRPDVSG